MAVAARNFVSERLCPIFQVSNVTGENIGHVKSFLNLLQPSVRYRAASTASVLFSLFCLAAAAPPFPL